MDLNNIAFVDIETTGSSAYNDRILEIAIICVKNNKIEKEYSTLVNPEMPFSPFIEMMTGIKQQDVEDAPTFNEIQQNVFDLLENRLFIAHNVGFDYGFIKQEFKRLGLSFSADRCCTVRLSRHLFPDQRRHNLDSLIERFGFTCENRHRAYSDTSVLWQFYQYLSKTMPEDKLLEAVQIISKQPSVPPHLEKSVIDSLTESPGVYIFYGEEGIPLYIGKSKSIKDRVLSHFGMIYESEKEREIFQQIRKIEIQETAGEFGALLLEAELIKEYKPVYNRQLRNCEEFTFIVNDTNSKGYSVPRLQTISGNNIQELTDIIAVHKNKSQAKKHLAELSNEYQLCRVMLGLEKSSSGCFDHKIGKCAGACLSKESTMDYNLRFMQAFSRTKIQEWPFPGLAMIEEIDGTNKEGEKYLFDNWCYLGSVKHSQEAMSFKTSSKNNFDYDMYMILRKYLKSNRHIKQLPRDQFEKMRDGYFT